MSLSRNIQVIDYTEKSIVLIGIGDTFDKNSIIALGGKFHPRIIINNEITFGWIFPKNKKSVIQSFIENTTSQESSVIKSFENTTSQESWDDTITISMDHYQHMLEKFEKIKNLVIELKSMIKE